LVNFILVLKATEFAKGRTDYIVLTEVTKCSQKITKISF